MLIYNLARAYRQVSQQFHQSVRDSGLSVPEWRILASLHGRAQRNLAELSARTFIDSFALVDMLVPMRDAGLCEVSGEPVLDDPSLIISGTAAGHERVEHLFELGQTQEKLAVHGTESTGVVGDSEKHQLEDFHKLISMLQRVINNTK